MKNLGLKLLSLFVACSLLLPTLAGCKSASSQLSWDAQEDQVVSLDMAIENDDETTTLVISHDEDFFSTVKNNRIKLICHRSAEVDGEAKSGDFIPTEITDFKIKSDNAKQLTVTLDRNEADNGFSVVVHSSATKSEKFGEATAFIEQNIPETKTPTATLGGEFSLGDKDPVITLELENATVVSDITADMLTLNGLFSSLEIIDVTESGNSLTVITKGSIPYSTPLFGGVTLSAEALEEKVSASAECDIIYRSSYISQDSFALSDNALSFDMICLNGSFSFAVGDTLTCDDLTLTVNAISEDKTTLTLSCPVNASDIDSAIALAEGKVITLPAGKTDSDVDEAVTVYASKAVLASSISKVTAAEEGGFTGDAVLFVKNGSWAKELTPEDISFEGDFENAKVLSVTKEENVYRLNFSFENSLIDAEVISASGSVAVAEDSISNAWGSISPLRTAEIGYCTPAYRLDGYTEIIALVPGEAGIFDKISKIGGYFGTAGSVATGVYTMLGMLGIVESTNAKINHVRELVKEVQQSIAVLDEKMDKLSSSLIGGNAETISAVQYNTYVLASGNWDNFINAYVTPGQNMMNDFDMAYNEYMLNYIMNAHSAEGAVTVWKDANGDVTLPHPQNNTNSTKYSIEGVVLADITDCHLTSELTKVQGKVMQNGGRLYTGYWSDVIAELEGKLPAGVEKADYLDSVQMNATLYAINTLGAAEILNTYTNFCNAINGQGSNAGLKPLDNYLTMLSMYYNFYVESAEDIQLTATWLHALMLRMSFVATMAYNMTPSAKENLINDCYSLTAQKLNDVRTAKDPLYSYIANKTLTAKPVNHYYKNSLESVWIPYENAITIGTGSEKIDLLPDTLKDGEYMTQLQISLMYKRYEILCRSGATNAATFRDYLISLGIVDKESLYDENGNPKDAQIIAGPVEVKDIPLDCSVEMDVTYIRESTWVEVGDVVSIGSSGKLNKKHFDPHFKRCADTVDLNGKLTEDFIILGYAFYGEYRWYWITPEVWKCVDMYFGQMFAFTLS